MTNTEVRLGRAGGESVQEGHPRAPCFWLRLLPHWVVWVEMLSFFVFS